MEYVTHTFETAPEAARDHLKRAQSAYGFVPNLLGVIAEAPALLKGYTTLSGIFEETSFTPVERQVILLSVSRANGCEYCVSVHSAIAARQEVAPDVIDAIRDGHPIGDARLQALRTFIAAVVEKRGWPNEQDVEAFLESGYSKGQILEVVLGVGLKTLSNYANHIARTPLDEAFASAAWSEAA